MGTSYWIGLFWALAACVVLAASPVLATAQEHEILWLDGERLSMISNPLSAWLEQNPGSLPDSEVFSTGRWRGYLGEWEVRDGRLLLRDLKVLESKDREFFDVSVMSEVFGSEEAVPARWFSGYLIVPTGKRKKYVHMGYASSYSRYLILEVVQGRLVSQERMRHGAFERFRLRQFEAFKATQAFENAVEALVDQDTSREEAVEHLFEAASVSYLSGRFDV